MSLNKTCLAPWKALSIRPNGTVLPDGQFEKPFGNINVQELDDILNSQDVKNLRQTFLNHSFSSACQNCQKKENSIGHSRRLFFEHKLRQFNGNAEMYLDEAPDIQYLDLNLSNKCNLKCRMCSSHSSSAWVSEEKKLLATGPVNFRLNKNPSYLEVDYDKVLKSFNNPHHFRNIRHIALQGGEPLLEEKNILVLQKFVDWGLAPQITIDISTNGTVIPHAIQNLAEKFKCIDMYVSIEAVGSLYQYIRGGPHFSILDLEKHLVEFRKIQNIHLFFASTASIYNVLHLHQLLLWFETIRQNDEELILSNTVVRPEYLSFHILPRKLKQWALSRIEETSSPSEQTLSRPHRFSGSGKELICEKLKVEIYSPSQKKKLIEQFLSFNNAIDGLRSTHLLDVVPELAVLADKNSLNKLLEDEQATFTSSNHTSSDTHL